MGKNLQQLPLGINSLQKIVDHRMVYIDKTGFAWQLADRPGAYFLSRPRRFGKSLFLDTLHQLFEGNEPLFQGLFIHDKWDWSTRYPVIKIDFAGGVLQSREELDHHIFIILQENQQRLGVKCSPEQNSIAGCFAEMIRLAREKYQQRVVILVDEYDKPILDNIDQPDLAAQMREGVKNLYSVMKGADADIQFIFMTGVSKFSKVSLFSGLNQLKDITLSKRFAAICGYTRHDLDTNFAEHLAGVDRDSLQHWYNGYNFLGESVYNPYDILLFISEDHSYRNYWFETGSPEFLVKLFKKNQYFLPDLEQLEVSEEILDSFDVERINPVTLLFQTGYLTVADAGEKLGEFVFSLKVPNHEVRTALNNQLFDAYTDLAVQRLHFKNDAYAALAQGNPDGLTAVIKRLFTAIPWRNFTKNDLIDTEGYYASVLYAFFASLAGEIIPEDITNHGQADLTIKIAGYIYIIEIKLDRENTTIRDRSENPALCQIREKGYSEKYQNQPGKGVFELGLVFSSRERNLVRADWVTVPQ
jgi:hypothetical protein